MACPECGGILAAHYERGENVCRRCGCAFPIVAGYPWEMNGIIGVALGFDESKERGAEARQEIGSTFYTNILGDAFTDLKTLQLDTAKKARKEEYRRRRGEGPADVIERFWKSEAPKHGGRVWKKGWTTLTRGKAIRALLDHGYSLNFIAHVLQERGLDKYPKDSYIIYRVVERYKKDVLELWIQYSKNHNIKNIDVIDNVIAQIAAHVKATPWCVKLTLVYSKILPDSWLLSNLLSEEVRPIIEEWGKRVKECSKNWEIGDLIKAFSKKYKKSPHMISKYVSAITPLNMTIKFYAAYGDEIVKIIEEHQPIKYTELQEKIKSAQTDTLKLILESGKIKVYSYEGVVGKYYYIDDKYRQVAEKRHEEKNITLVLRKIIDESGDGFSARGLAREYEKRTGKKITSHNVSGHLQPHIKNGHVAFIPFLGEEKEFGLYIKPPNVKGRKLILKGYSKKIVETLEKNVALRATEIAKIVGLEYKSVKRILPKLLDGVIIHQYPAEAFPSMNNIEYYTGKGDITEIRKLYLNNAGDTAKVYDIVRSYGEITGKEISKVYSEIWHKTLPDSPKKYLINFRKHGLVEAFGKRDIRYYAAKVSNEDSILNLIQLHTALTIREIGIKRNRVETVATQYLNNLVKKGLIHKYPKRRYVNMTFVMYYADKSQINEVKRMHFENAKPAVKLYQIIKEHSDGILTADLIKEYNERVEEKITGKLLYALLIHLVDNGSLIRVKKGYWVEKYKIPDEKLPQKALVKH